MATPRRPRVRTSGTGSARRPNRAATTPEVADLLNSMASLLSHRPSGHRVPTAATPEKCGMEMTPAGFRTWRRSVQTWLRLAAWPDQEAVLHVRLLCVPDLQCALDARFSSEQWEALNPTSALDAIERLVLQSTNQAVKWTDFFSTCQAPGESVGIYMTRCAQEARECGFRCPDCDSDLSEYMLLRKVMVGLHDPALKQDVFRRCDSFKDMDDLRGYCSTYEAAQRDAAKFTREHAVAGTDIATSDISEDEEPLVAAYRQPSHPAKTAHRRSPADAPPKTGAKHCPNCGEKHGHEKTSCPAFSRKCGACGKRGHFRRVCRSSRTQEASKLVSGVIIGSATLSPEPVLQVCVGPLASKVGIKVTAVADTGAQVCVAGPAMMTSLGLKPAQLQRRAGIRDLAKIPITSLGATPCRIGIHGRSTVQDVYFVRSVERMYLSFTTCKELGLIDANFPRPLPLVANAEQVYDDMGNDVPSRLASPEDTGTGMSQTILQCERQAGRVTWPRHIRVRPEPPAPSNPRQSTPASGRTPPCRPPRNGFDAKKGATNGILTVTDICQLEGHHYLVYADRLTGWLEVSHLAAGTTACEIRDRLRQYFCRWGAPEQLSMDGGTNLGSEEMRTFLKRWGVTVRISSAHYPQSNGRAEAAVKTAKRVLRGNISADGSLDTDNASLALLQYLNTPLRDINKSPAQLATGRQLRDGVPAIACRLQVDKFWGRTLRRRERQMGEHIESVLQEHTSTRRLSPLLPGNRVLVQDQHSGTWNRAGTVVEDKGNRQYIIRLDGSGRISLRTRNHLRPCNTPPHANQSSDVNQRTPETELVNPPSPEHHTPAKRQIRPPRWLKDYVT
ncbi:uncharacterized protein LOC143038319 [Oratosquilla oratoria]|uniref:uncharacterized protein LOC143038319 n=1 Tax=Oratosquilla oratoria TaxID=337810 RepID=UPI003F76AF2F